MDNSERTISPQPSEQSTHLRSLTEVTRRFRLWGSSQQKATAPALSLWCGWTTSGVVYFECSHFAAATEDTETCFAESHAAALKHNVIRIEKATGSIKRYLQLTTVTAAKHAANAHAVPRINAKVTAGRRASCHANMAANR